MQGLHTQGDVAGRADARPHCILCGSADVLVTKYLRLNSRNAARNLAYALPDRLASLLSAISKRFAAAHRPVKVNKQYFNRQLAYCQACSTGWALPFFDESELAEYYRSFYWSNRDSVDGHHVPLEDRPNDRQLALTRDRILWLGKFGISYQAIIDLGAGDCSATYQFYEDGVRRLHVVDPSSRAQALAHQYGAAYSPDLADAPVVDLVYSAHSLEHVADLRMTLRDIAAKTNAGGHIFFETPNVPDVQVFLGLSHTPHTYMLSETSFRNVSDELPLQIVAAETCGPEWRVSHPQIDSNARADLRVLLKKIDVMDARTS